MNLKGKKSADEETGLRASTLGKLTSSGKRKKEAEAEEEEKRVRRVRRERGNGEETTKWKRETARMRRESLRH